MLFGWVTGGTAVVASSSVASGSWQNVHAHMGGGGCDGQLSAGSFYGFQTERVVPLTLTRSHRVGSGTRGQTGVWLAVKATPYLGT